MRFFNTLIIITISSIFILPSSCNNLGSFKIAKQEYTNIDSIWLQFAVAMESKDFVFLETNSLDSITCYDCDIEPDIDKVYFDSKYIFRSHMDKLMHLRELSKKDFSTFQVDSNLIQVIYNINAEQAPESSYGLIFTLTRKDSKYLLQGMMVQ